MVSKIFLAVTASLILFTPIIALPAQYPLAVVPPTLALSPSRASTLDMPSVSKTNVFAAYLDLVATQRHSIPLSKNAL
jgi:hypothetical protein